MAKLLEAHRFVDMSVGCSYRYVNSATEYFREHTHDYFEIFIMLEGRARHFINGECMELATSDAVFVRAKDTHNYEPINGEPFSFLNLTFTRETLNDILAFLGSGYPADRLMRERLSPTVRIGGGELMRLLSDMEKITAIAPDAAAERGTAIRVLLLKLFADIFSSFASASDRTPEWLLSLVESMQNELCFTDGIARMVELSGKSREHLTRSVKKYLGKTPSEFINELRLNYIANMLVSSNHKILDIIIEAGFNTVSYASSVFRREYGISMSEYRKRRGARKK